MVYYKRTEECVLYLNIRVTHSYIMAEEKVKHKEPSFLKSFTAGGVGGLALVCTGHPLDTIKV